VRHRLAKTARSAHHLTVASYPALKAALPGRLKIALRRWFLRVSSILNTGSSVSCPCCGSSFRKFARFHGINDQCPSCGSLMRQRVVTLYLRDVLRVPERGGDILHVGPASSVRGWLVSFPDVRYVSVDLSSPLADVKADITDLPFPDASHDLIVCLHVLEHVPEDRKAISELFRVLRPGGKAIIQVPPSPFEETLEDPTVTDPAERERRYGQYDHVRLCGADYLQRLEEPGFQVTREDYAARLNLATRSLYEIHAGEPFYVCVKPTA
jgi:SAM-dependent methyltransferase